MAEVEHCERGPESCEPFRHDAVDEVAAHVEALELAAPGHVVRQLARKLRGETKGGQRGSEREREKESEGGERDRNKA